MIKSPSKYLGRHRLREIVARDGLVESGLEYSVDEARDLLNEKETRLANTEFTRQLKERLQCDHAEVIRKFQARVFETLNLNTEPKI